MSDATSQLDSPQPPPATSELQTPKVVRRNLRDAVEDVFWDMGGVGGMIQWAAESTANKRIFYKDILPKLIPKEIRGEFSGPGGGPMKMVIEWADQNPLTGNPLPEQIGDTPASIIMNAVTQCIDED